MTVGKAEMNFRFKLQAALRHVAPKDRAKAKGNALAAFARGSADGEAALNLIRNGHVPAAARSKATQPTITRNRGLRGKLLRGVSPEGRGHRRAAFPQSRTRGPGVEPTEAKARIMPGACAATGAEIGGTRSNSALGGGTGGRVSSNPTKKGTR